MFLEFLAQLSVQVRMKEDVRSGPFYV